MALAGRRKAKGKRKGRSRSLPKARKVVTTSTSKTVRTTRLGRYPMPPAAAVASLENRGSALDRLGRSNVRPHRPFKLKNLSAGMKTLAIVGGIGIVGVLAVALAPKGSGESFGS